MFPFFRRFALLLATFGLAGGMSSMAASIHLYANKYATSEDYWQKGAYTSCVASQQPIITPSDTYVYSSVDPYLKTPTNIVYAFTFDGHYAANWALLEHGGSVDKHLKEIPNSWYGLSVTYVELTELSGYSSGIDIVPLFAEMRYTLAYNPGTGGAWIAGKEPVTTNLWWSNTIVAQPSNLCARTGYHQTGWRVNAQGSGNLIACEQSMTGATFPVTNHNQAVTLYAQWSANPYTLQLQPGVGIDKIYYKTSASAEWQSTSVTQDVSVAYGETWSAYAVAKVGYKHSATSADNPKSAKMGTDGAVFAPAATANKYKLRLVPGTGIATIYYKINGATVWSSTGAEREVEAEFNTKWYAYAQAKDGYTYTETTAESPHEEIMGTSGATFNPVASVNSYNLKLTPGTGIAKIFYGLGTETTQPSVWNETVVATNVSYAYKSVWYAYAEAKPGYTHTATSKTNPTHGTIGTSGGKFEPTATANKITLIYDGNGKTSGSMSTQYFYYDASDALYEFNYVRGYDVSFNGQGGTPEETKKTAAYPHQDGDKCWNSQPDGKGAYSYADKQMVVNPCGSTGEVVTLYAQWDLSENKGIALPGAIWNGHDFSGWYSKGDCKDEDYVGKKGDLYTPTNNVTLYAKWSVNTYTVTFYDDDPENGGKVLSSQKIEYGKSAVEPEHPTKDYYKFSKWNTEEWKKVTEDLKVWALWVGKQYKVVYNSNYVNGQKEKSIAGDSCGPEETAKKITLDDATTYNMEKIGYEFSGWETNALSKAKKWSSGATLHYIALDELGGGAEKVNFYAIWAPKAYKVKFNKGAEAATGTMAEQEFTYDQAQPLTKNAFTYAGQEFQGWATSSVDAEALRVTYTDQQLVSNLTTEANGIVTLTAVWSNYHYVRFDRNGATNETEMALQTFSGAETNALLPNAYGKIGYTFAGWATNTGDAAACRVAYTNCQSASFPLAQPNETNVLYAVWATNHYTIVFDPGTNGVYGSMAPITNCAYDTAVTVECGYTNYCSSGLLGWSTNAAATTADFPVTGQSPATLGANTIISNLTAEANATQTLYAVWADVGELSKAVGLTNAVLYSSQETKTASWRCASESTYDWDKGKGHAIRVACVTTSSSPDEGTRTLSMKVVGRGVLRFLWCSRLQNDQSASYVVRIDDVDVTNLYSKAMYLKRNWNDPIVLRIDGEGEHAISWVHTATLNKSDVIAIDDVTWTEGVVVDPSDPPTYESQEAAEAAAKAARVMPPNDAVEQVISASDYNALFDVHAVPSLDGKWTLAPELKPAVSNRVQKAVDVATTNLVDQFRGDAVSHRVYEGQPFTVTMSMQAGLYYGIATTNEVEWLGLAAPTNWVLGTGRAGGEPLSVGAPSPTAGYFEVRSTPTPPDR